MPKCNGFIRPLGTCKMQEVDPNESDSYDLSVFYPSPRPQTADSRVGSSVRLLLQPGPDTARTRITVNLSQTPVSP